MTTLISRDELRAAIEAGTVTVVDALPEPRWAQQHLPGALNVAEDQVVEKASELLPNRDADIVVYCANATCHSSQAVASQLQRLGYTRVRKYREGIQDWVAAGLPVEAARSHLV
jgi:rhodanese-related sulfurtransferase